MSSIHPKVIGAASGTALGVALTTIVVWLLNAYAHANIPTEVGGAIGTVIATGLALIGGYLPASPDPPIQSQQLPPVDVKGP